MQHVLNLLIQQQIHYHILSNHDVFVTDQNDVNIYQSHHLYHHYHHIQVQLFSLKERERMTTIRREMIQKQAAGDDNLEIE
ncbi:MAG: hypothetical protein ACI8RD_006921 [Bacillariaceae sp.]|jgi:hypothetical protein